MLSEICNANESEGGLPVVIMSDVEKEEMEEVIAKHCIRFRGSRVICRHDTPSRSYLMYCLPN